MRCVICFLVEIKLILTELQSFKNSHFGTGFALSGMKFVKSTPFIV